MSASFWILSTGKLSLSVMKATPSFGNATASKRLYSRKGSARAIVHRNRISDIAGFFLGWEIVWAYLWVQSQQHHLWWQSPGREAVEWWWVVWWCLSCKIREIEVMVDEVLQVKCNYMMPAHSLAKFTEVSTSSPCCLLATSPTQ